MQPPDEENQDLSGIPRSGSILNAQTIAKEPDLVTIHENEPLTDEQLELEREELEFSEELNEQTPLLGRSTETDRSFADNKSLSQSQASLFIPSVQFSLYSGRGGGEIARSLDNSVRVSIHDTNTSRVSKNSKNFTITLIEKLAGADGQASGILAGWNIVNVIQGSGGVLGIPFAVSQGGFAALAVIVLVGLMTLYTGVVLIDCMYEVSPKSRLRKRVRGSYAEIAADAWGPVGGVIVDFMTVAFCYCTCVVLFMMLGNTVFSFLKSFMTLGFGLNECYLICAALLVPLVLIHQLTVLAWLSMLAVLSLITCLFIIIGYSLQEWQSWKIHNIPDFDINNFPVAIGIIVFSYCGHSVFPGIESSMRKPRKFKKIACTSFTSVTLCKVAIGLLCCLLYGPHTLPLITLNIQSEAKNVVMRSFMAVFIIVNTYFSFPLNIFVASETLDLIALPKLPSCSVNKLKRAIWKLLTRTTLVLSTCGIAVAIPHLGLLMSIFGSLLGACISFILPCALHLTLKRDQLRCYQVVLEVLVIIFGFSAGMLGFVYSCIAMHNQY
ncbi:predicted protein [Nematostella vectensis]|uniref:Vesicular inhibitory amino acid transporter n=2 Tax=Nematostella vectensis TaxID=45351 RepID=A7RXN0_NEMVE|nr:predicted protein [Nematostella vectensis]|eukprot:XP_001635867.1 predicted protein [Nematostella vectensis]